MEKGGEITRREITRREITRRENMEKRREGTGRMVGRKNTKCGSAERERAKSMSAGRMNVGRRGEEEACRKLEELGHTVVARNWRSGHLEVDIISVHRDGIHFVEVKSRMAPASAEPEENVTALKQKRITEAANRFLHSASKEKFADMDIFFDVVSVIFERNSAEVKYFPQAYIPLYI